MTGAGSPADRVLEAPADLGSRAARGAAVTLAGQAARIGLQLVSVVVLARLLAPRDYGLLAVGLVVVGIGEIIRDLGLSTAAIRAPQLTRGQRDALFWVNTAVGVLLAGLVHLASGGIAAVFGQPALADLLAVLSLTFVVNGLATQYRADLARHLRFGALAAIEVSAQLVALVVAVTAAAQGAGYWALAAQQLTQVGIVLVGVALACRWLPGRPRKAAGVGPLLRLGGSLTGTQLLHYAGSNLDTVVLGLRAGPAAVGVYNRAWQLLMTPLNQLRSPATTVAVPVLSRIQDDRARSGEYLRRAQLAFGYTLVAGLAVAAGASVPLVEVLLGARWLPAAPVLTLLAVAGGAQTLAYVGYWVYLSRGLGGALMRYTLLTVALKATFVLAGSTWGLLGVAGGYALAALAEWPLSLWWLARITPIPRRELVTGALRITACAVAAGAGAFLATLATDGATAPLRLLAALLAGAAVYGVALLVPAVRTDLGDVAQWGRRMIDRTA